MTSLSSQEWLTREEVANYLDIKSRTLDVWASQKRGPKYVKVGRRVKYHIDDIENFINSRAK